MHCPYEINRGDEGHGRCAILTVACGFTVTNGDTICAYCISGKAWNDAAVEQLEPDAEARVPSEADAMALVTDSPFFASLYEASLTGRLVNGDCPKYQEKAPFDMPAAFTKYVAISFRSDAEDLLGRMYERHSRIQEEDGGDSLEVMTAKLEVIAEQHDMSDALLEVALAHERPAVKELP